MEQNQETVVKHLCRLCSKSFPCGRSLGGHMRSHLASNPSETGETSRNPSSGGVHTSYVLRENPKKACKFADSNVEDTLLQNLSNKVCKECGKRFQSWKALFGHMKCHSQKSKNPVKEAGCWNVVTHSHSGESDQAAMNAPNRKKRSKRASKRYQLNAAAATNSSTLTNSDSVCVLENDDEYEQEDVAMSLILLSRDVGGWDGFNSVSECSDNNSEFLGIQQETGDTESNKSKKPKSEAGKCRESKLSDIIGFSSLDSEKKIKFECSTCDKTFQSYQALGGHRASHKKTDNKDTSPADRGESTSKKIKVAAHHECPICFKIFPSGQALGGHKRSHLIAVQKTNQQPPEMQKPEPTRDFLDLNLPAPVEEDDGEINQHEIAGLQAWLMMGSNYKHEQIVDPTF